MKKRFNKIRNHFLGISGTWLGILCLSLTISGCGSSSTDPLTVLGSAPFPQLNSITSGNTYNTLYSAYTQANPYWTFATGVWTSINYLAPANGVVSQVGAASSGGNYVVMLHSGRLATKLVGLSLVQVRSGDTVTAGQTIGEFTSLYGVQFYVLVDGAPVCPLSYLSPAFRQTLVGFFGATQPCTN